MYFIFADRLQLCKRRIGSTSGVGWKGKHNHKKTGRRENVGGKCPAPEVLAG